MAVLLAAFWLLMQAGLWNKSATYDEGVHAVAGAASWTRGDFRLNPENGNLPERIAGLPIALGKVRFSATDSAAWKQSREWDVADQVFFHLGNDPVALLREGRAFCGLIAVALGAAVWACARRMSGAAGGLVALLFYALDPTALAHGSLMTSDCAAALGFVLSAAAVSALLKRLTPLRLAAAGAALGLLAVSKMSAFLILPAALALGLVRTMGPWPLEWRLGPVRGQLSTRLGRLAAVAASAVACAILAAAVIWAFYGFRFRAFGQPPGPGEGLEPGWDKILGAEPRHGLAAVFGWARSARILPEAYLYGNAYAWKFSQLRDSFWNGQHSLTGWRGFFPYAFLVKTPLPFMAALALAGFAAVRGSCRLRSRWLMLSLAMVAAVDALAAILGHLDIGIRHILPVYAVLCVLAGAAARDWAEPGRRWVRAALALVLAWSAFDTAISFPDYLAYFNGLVSRKDAYRHLVDSSLDWGQDLPAAAAYVSRDSGSGPFFLSYFGSSSPAAYGIAAGVSHCASPAEPAPGALAVMTVDFAPERFRVELESFLSAHPEYEAVGSAVVNDTGWRRAILLKKAAALRLVPGTYLVSATVLQQMQYNLKAPWGPWNRRYEERYRQLREIVRPLLSADPGERAAALAAGSMEDWQRLLNDVLEFDELRFSRLTAALRKRAPDGQIHGSILVYRLGRADLDSATEGPPPELGRDLPAELAARQRD